jgi:hypothetical protein
MYNGRVIDQLMDIVSHAEERAFADAQLALKKSVQNTTGFYTHIYELDSQLRYAGAA